MLASTGPATADLSFTLEQDPGHGYFKPFTGEDTAGQVELRAETLWRNEVGIHEIDKASLPADTDHNRDDGAGGTRRRADPRLAGGGR